jgi:hypothetical protein
MKKAAVLAFVVILSVGMFHYFYAEDHCPVHCPTRGGGFGHVHPHHPTALTCLCFWSSMFGPESEDLTATAGLVAVLSAPAAGRPLSIPAADIAHPPKSLPV